MKNFCILFAGPVGSSKSPIANHISCKLNLPIFNNDCIRTEIREDLLKFDNTEYKNRRASRIKDIVESGIAFIYDASIDRRWEELSALLKKKDYSTFIVSLDFSKEKLQEIYKAKSYNDFKALDRTYQDHKEFIKQYGEIIDISLGDTQFQNRLKIVLESIQEHIGQHFSELEAV